MAPGAHAVLLLDQAGWHTSPQVKVPANTTLLPLPPRSPELNAVENVWPFLRDNWLSDRIFGSYEQIVDHGCEAWNKLIEQRTSSSSSPGSACPSACATGPMGSNQRTLV